ncbi:hypothetical protein, partial [Pseudonocardia zijingensis]|uniref:hypothetical protein n=1 Tax=Pseudonocardia zijingensis TaxID=153376 RepID=UPI0031D05CC3
LVDDDPAHRSTGSELAGSAFGRCSGRAPTGSTGGVLSPAPGGAADADAGEVCGPDTAASSV